MIYRRHGIAWFGLAQQSPQWFMAWQFIVELLFFLLLVLCAGLKGGPQVW